MCEILIIFLSKGAFLMDFSILIFLAVGIFTGIIGALLGLGGGVVIVPFLVFVSHYEPQLAIGTSMFVVLLNSVSGALGYIRRKLACTDAAIRFSLATIPGAFIGSYAAKYLQGKIFLGVFGLLLVGIAFNMFRKAEKSSEENGVTEVPEHYNRKLGIICSIFVGFLASVLGIGGGVIHVPFMIYVLRFPVKVAIATSTCILAVSAIAGASSHAYLGHIMWFTGLALGIGAAIGAQIGVRLAAVLKSALLMKGTGVLVAMTGIKILISAFGA